jgi:hypothetical protein
MGRKRWRIAGWVFSNPEQGFGELSLAQPVLLKLGNFSEFMPYLAAKNLRWSIKTSLKTCLFWS